MVGLWWCACLQYICTCIGFRTLSFARSLSLPLPFVLTFGNCWCLCVLICDMVALANICSLKMAYVSRSLFMPFALSLSCLPLSLSLILSHSLAWIQCRLHISLYIPRVLCYPLTLSHMQFVWSDTSVSVTKYTHTHKQTTKWRVAADFFKCCCCRFLYI